MCERIIDFQDADISSNNETCHAKQNQQNVLHKYPFECAESGTLVVR